MRLWLSMSVVFSVFCDYTSAGFHVPHGGQNTLSTGGTDGDVATALANANAAAAAATAEQQNHNHHHNNHNHNKNPDGNSGWGNGGGGDGDGGDVHQEPNAAPVMWTEPYFDAMIQKNVTALVGKSAYLSCKVRNLGNKTVSWIRHRDIHILTVGAYTYTSDQRFQATYHKDTDDWTLHIKWAQKRDAGMYECQISTQPVRSFFVNLDVVVPTAAILGEPDLHVDKGSTINLTCSVKYSPEPPAYIFWYHHDEVISYDSTRGGVSVITEKGDVTTSYLLIQNADLADSGKYSCSPSNAELAIVRVHVLNGEHPEAMQTNAATACCYCRQRTMLTLAMLAALALGVCIMNPSKAGRWHNRFQSADSTAWTNCGTLAQRWTAKAEVRSAESCCLRVVHR